MVVPAYNEEELIEPFVQKSVRDLSAVTNDFEIVLVNDGSTDQTLPIARRLSQEFPQLKVVDAGRNLGTGANMLPGFRAATKEWILNNTVDAFFNTEDLPRLLSVLDGADGVSGYRTDLSANNPYQKLLTLGNFCLIRLLFGVNLKAFQTVQIHRRDFLSTITIDARSSFVSPELLIRAHAAGKVIREVPVVFHKRTAGRSKGGSLRHVARTFKDILRFWWRWKVLARG